MRTTAAKPEEKRLDGSVKTGVDQTKAGSSPPLRQKIVLNSSDRCPNHGTTCTRDVIGAENSNNMQEKAFHLGNVSLTKYSLLSEAELL